MGRVSWKWTSSAACCFARAECGWPRGLSRRACKEETACRLEWVGLLEPPTVTEYPLEMVPEESGKGSTRVKNLAISDQSTHILYMMETMNEICTITVQYHHTF